MRQTNETTTASPPSKAPKGGEAAPSTQANPLWIMGIVAALFVAVILPRLRRKRSAPESLGTFEPVQRDARHELERLLTDIQDISREHIARLDTKIRMLNQLLLECDQKQRHLESLLGRSPAPAPLPEKPPPAAHRPSNPLHEQVYSLKDGGKELTDICSATGLEKGEVELILGLRGMSPRPSQE